MSWSVIIIIIIIIRGGPKCAGYQKDSHMLALTHTLLVLGYTFFFLNKHTWALISCGVPSTRCWKRSLRDFGPYWHDSSAQLLQICRLHMYDVNLPFQRRSVGQIWRLEAIRVQLPHFHIQETSFIEVSVTKLKLNVHIRKWLKCGHKDVKIVSNNTLIRLVSKWCLADTKGPKWTEKPQHNEHDGSIVSSLSYSGRTIQILWFSLKCWLQCILYLD